MPMTEAHTLLPSAFWNALSNQNITDYGNPQWSIVVNDSGIQCSIFFESENSISSKTSNISTNSSITNEKPGIAVRTSSSNSTRGEVSPIKSDQEMRSSERQNSKFSENVDDESVGEEINCTDPDPSPIHGIHATAPTASFNPMINPLAAQFLLHQFRNQQTPPTQPSNPTNFRTDMSPAVAPPNPEEIPTPGDLMLIPNENRRRLVNLREEAQASRLSVTAFIRRGALLYFDSDELAVNRLHTLNQQKLHALELETKYYFGDVPQQLFRRTIAIQQSQIRSKKSSSHSSADRERTIRSNIRNISNQTYTANPLGINPALFANMNSINALSGAHIPISSADPMSAVSGQVSDVTTSAALMSASSHSDTTSPMIPTPITTSAASQISNMMINTTPLKQEN